MIKMHDIFSKQGSNGKLPRPRPTDIVYVIIDGYATFQGLISIISMKVFNLSWFSPFPWKSALILTPC